MDHAAQEHRGQGEFLGWGLTAASGTEQTGCADRRQVRGMV